MILDLMHKKQDKCCKTTVADLVNYGLFLLEQVTKLIYILPEVKMETSAHIWILYFDIKPFFA